MSDENNQPSGGASPPYPPTTSRHSAQTLSSEEEDNEGDEESSGGEPLFPEKENVEVNEYLEEEEFLSNLEEDQYLEEETKLKGKDYLYEQKYLNKAKYLQKEKHLEKKEHLLEKYLEKEFKLADSSQILPNLAARNPASGTAQGTLWSSGAAPPFAASTRESPLSDMMAPSSCMKWNGESLTWQHQGTQTEWTYETMSASIKLPLAMEQESSTAILTSSKAGTEVYITSKVSQKEENVMDFVSQGSCLDGVLNEPTDMQDGKDLDNSLFNSSYQSVLRALLKGSATCSELEEDIDIPLTGHLDSEARRKLGSLLKKNYDKYKETILWNLKKRENLFSPQIVEIPTFTFHLPSQPPKEEEESETEVKKSHRTVRRKEKLEVDTEWIKSKTEVQEGDGKLILYPSENVFQIIFHDGSGQIHYPSGNVALLILSTKERELTYIILEDSEEMCFRAFVNNSGHATFYDENGEIWLSLSRNLGYYFNKSKRQKAWNWWNLNVHAHAPPVQSISLKINRYIEVKITGQDKIIFRFVHQKKHICLNLGTKYKLILPEMLSEMQQKAVLDMESGSTALKIHILLGKMSKILNFLTISDLEIFIKAAKILLASTMSMTKKSLLPD
ncbi:glutamate-rich protein 6B isoform X1 [Manis javanica]|uniref:glutamate-rich protein 6B isoform X1 n=1 Tax=Manis javanica TaxID=9974 RepID=UPI003C6D739C